MKNIIISDLTLKAVKEQDLSLKFKEKLLVAELLDSARVDALELPALTNSKDDEIIYRTISASVKNATVKIPVGDSIESLQLAYDCVKGATKPCLQVVMPVSTALMEYNYHLKAPQMQIKIAELIVEAKKLTNCVELVAVDAFRAESGFVKDLAKTAFEAGAVAITLCDEAGEALPEDYAQIVKEIKAESEILVFVQPSNALSMSASSAVQAVMAGVDGIKTSALGSYLTLPVFSDLIRAKKYDLGVECSVDSTAIKTICSKIDCVIKGSSNEQDNIISTNCKVEENATLSEVSELIKRLGYELSDSDIGKVFEEVKKLTNSNKSIDEKELETIIASNAMQVPSTYHLINYVVNSGNNIPATANIILEKDGQRFTGVSTGDGPIDAAFNAIEQIIGHHYELDDFQVHAATKGRGAVGTSIIRLRADGKLYPGNGASTDIIGACIRAYINALNKIVYGEK